MKSVTVHSIERPSQSTTSAIDPSFDGAHIKVSIFLIVVSVLLLTGLILDLVADWTGNIHLAHLYIETILIILIIVLITGLVSFAIHLHSYSKKLAAQLRSKSSSIEEFAKSFQSKIEDRFLEWDLTETEQEIASYIFRGFSFNDIAMARKVSERTVRQQAQQIYKKSQTGNRSEFASTLYEIITSQFEELKDLARD